MSYAGGTGTELDPYLIANWEHLRNIELNQGSYFALINDIDCSGAGLWKAVYFGASKLDGRGHLAHSISYMFGPATTGSNAGIFVDVIGGEIRRLAVDLRMGLPTTSWPIAGFVTNLNDGLIEDCLVSGFLILHQGPATGILAATTGNIFPVTVRRVVLGATGYAQNAFYNTSSGIAIFEDNYRIGDQIGTVTAGQATHVTENIGLDASYPGLDFVNTWEITPIGPRLRVQGLVAVSGGPVVSGVTPAEYVSLVNTDTEQVYRATVAGDGTWTATVPPGNYRRISWINDPDCRTCSEIGVVS